MITEQRDALLGEIRDAEESLRQLKGLIRDFASAPVQIHTHRQPGSPRRGQRVMVWAAHANSEGDSFNGNEAEVLDEITPAKPFKETIEVRLLEPMFNGMTVRVYPQQCVLVAQSGGAQ